jgi:hypothetical protein
MRVNADDLVYVHTGVRGAAEAVAFGVVATDQPVDYQYELFGELVGWEEAAEAIRHAHSVYVARYNSDDIRLDEAGGVRVSAAPEEPLARFGGQLEMLGASTACGDEGRVHLTTRWRIGSEADVDASVFAHLVQADGAVVAQADGRALRGMLPLWLWEPGEIVWDIRAFDPVSGGRYTVRLGVWEPASGRQWPAVGYPDGVISLTVRCP